LLVAVVVEDRSFVAPSRRPHARFHALLAIFVLLAVGEGAALVGLADRRTPFLSAPSATAVGAAVLGFGVTVLRRKWENDV
jgi:hypothetical protein